MDYANNDAISSLETTSRYWWQYVIAVVLYGCETWSLTLTEEHRFKVFQNRVMGRIFGPKGEKVAQGWRTLHNEELHNLYASASIIRESS
jgi:hypothetical protein